MQDQLIELENKINLFKLDLAKKLGIKEQINQIISEEKKILLSNEKYLLLSEKAYLFLITEIAERREKAIKLIEETATSALQHIYGHDYFFKFQTLEEKNPKSSQSHYKMSIQIGSTYMNQTIWTGAIDERGGGSIEIISFALRIAALSWLNYPGPLILDEAYKSMSSDDKLDLVANFLKHIAEETNRQIIFVTHKEDVFKHIASNIVEVYKEDGISKVKNS